MKNNIALVAALLTLSCAAPARAQQQPWTLRECIQYALDHNLTVKQNEITVQQKEVSLSTARSKYLPGVSASASQNFSFGRGLTADNTYDNANTTSSSFSLGGDLTLFDGLKTQNNIKLGKLDLETATADLEKARDDIRTNVAKCYVQILYDMEIADVARQQIEIDSVQAARLSEMALHGKASRAEVSSQEATLAKSRLTAVQADNDLSLAILDLTQLLELPSPEGFSIVRPSESALQQKMLKNPESVYLAAVDVRPAIKAEELRLDYAKTNIALAKGGYMPSLSLSGGIGTNYYTSSNAGYNAVFIDQLKNNFSQYIGLSLNVPIFQRFSVRNDVRQAKLSYNLQQVQLETTKKSLYKEIQQVYYNAVAAQSKLTSSIAAERSARESFDLSKAKYESGKAGITEFNEAKGRFVSACSDLVHARYECLYESSLLDFYEGSVIDF